MRTELLNKPSSLPAFRAGGLALVEAVISMVIVSVMLVAALSTVGASRTGEHKMATRARGLLLAQGLMSEILQCAYEDPDDPGTSLGYEVGESTINRTDYDDVDDYLGWDASPPEDRDGTVIPGPDGYRRIVNVEWINPSDLEQIAGSPTGIKRITVMVRHNDVPVGSLFAIRTSACADLSGR